MSTELIGSVDVQALVAMRDECLDRFEQVRAHAVAMKAIEGLICASGHHVQLPELYVGRNAHDFVDVTRAQSGAGPAASDVYRQRVDAAFWRLLFDRTQIMSLMSSERRGKWTTVFSGGQCEPFQPDVIAATFAGLYADRGDMLFESVLAVFQKRSWDHKTNQPVKLTPKMVFWYGHDHYRGPQTEWLDDLHRLLHVLDGRPEPDYNGSARGILEKRTWNVAGTYEHEYWTITIYKKGTAHIVIKRTEFIDRMNSMIAERFPNVLPPAK